MILKPLRKRPRAVAMRLRRELSVEAERFLSPARDRRFSVEALLRNTGASDLESLWRTVGERPYPAVTGSTDLDNYDQICPGDRQRILAAAEAALEHQVSLLGFGPISLGAKIEWQRDYRTGFTWPRAYIRGIEYLGPDRPSDVKMAWDLSRLQWLIPAGQAWLLTGHEKYAVAVREVLDSWIAANPYAHSVNWICTMEAALRTLTWSWFFHVFWRSSAWADPGFRLRFLRALYLHGDFTRRHLEYSVVNANHYTANAAGLVFAGLFFGQGRGPRRWQDLGWRMLCEELPSQVYPDGVNFEASVPYHRLVMELFLLPALYREAVGENVPAAYRARIVSMARFAAVYTRPDGSAPLWGDADDGRALPFGGQDVNDHRYLPGLVGAAWDVPELRKMCTGSPSEAYWLLGPSQASSLNTGTLPCTLSASTGFPHGGFYVMRSDRDHVFIDCGPVGLEGRGGHGHNDCLSFEAVLLGERLVSDCGSYVYTASYRERNLFRSTAYHNTPQVDGEEINRFVHPDHLWLLHNDALPEVRRWQTGPAKSLFCGSHSGYRRIGRPVTPVRTIVLDHVNHMLVVHDAFEAWGIHTVEIPLHLAPGVQVLEASPGTVRLRSPNRSFVLGWGPRRDWELSIQPARISPSYGLIVPSVRLSWRRTGVLETPLTVCFAPASEDPSAVSARERASALWPHQGEP